MIWDTIENGARYAGISGLFAQGLAALPQYAGKPAGRYELAGDDLFILVQAYDTRPLEDSVWEAHHAYIDIQCVLEGREYIGTAPAGKLTLKTPYDPAKDAELYSGQGVLCPCEAGSMLVFFPGEAHMPCVAVDAPAPVRKLVVKIKAAAM